MAKYRKMPIVIDAEQWFPGSGIAGVEEIDEMVAADTSKWPAYGIIRTLEGPMPVHPGDYVITGIKGEKYACKPDIFAATYEKVDE